MRILSAALLLFLFVACEKKPTEEEVAAQKEATQAAARATPTPKPGDWMWKQYNNPLEKKKGR